MVVAGQESLLITEVLVSVRSEVHHRVNLLRAVAEQALQVADEPVDVTLSRRFQDDVLVVIVSEPPGQLLVVHLGLVLPDAPPPGHLVRVGHLELPAVAGPDDEVLARLVRQQLQQELPQLGTRKSSTDVAKKGAPYTWMGPDPVKQGPPGACESMEAWTMGLLSGPGELEGSRWRKAGWWCIGRGGWNVSGCCRVCHASAW